MKHSIAALLFASLVTVRAATTLEVPEVLRETGATLSSDNGKVTFSVRSKTPLTPLEKLQADLPKLRITYTEVTPQTREKREHAAAKK